MTPQNQRKTLRHSDNCKAQKQMPDLSKLTYNVCRPTIRGVGDRPVENAWFPLWLLARHKAIPVADPPDILFYGDVGNGEQFLYPPTTTRVFMTGENIAPNWEIADYAFTHERIWNERHWRAPLWRHFYDPGITQIERNFANIRTRVDRFCNFIYSNPNALERIHFLKKLNARKSVDSGGKLLNNIGGPVKDKLAYLARCKFTIAFENESSPGYATEKIIEPLLMGSIPIYWGDTMIEDDFNPDCIINVHKFQNFDDVIDRVMEIDNNEKLWEKYVSAPIFVNNQIPHCLTNEAFLRFLDNIETKRSQIPYQQKQKQRISQNLRCAVDRSKLLADIVLKRAGAVIRKALNKKTSSFHKK